MNEYDGLLSSHHARLRVMTPRPIFKPGRNISLYEERFGPVRHTVRRVLEVGVGGGGSLQLWHDFFPAALVVGIDIRPETCQHEAERVKVRIGAQQDRVFLASVERELGPFDVIIDDGSHRWEDQRATFNYFWHRPWWFYAIEDLQTSYVPHEWKYREDDPLPEPFTHTLSRVADKMHLSGLSTSKWQVAQDGDDRIIRITTLPKLALLERGLPPKAPPNALGCPISDKQG